LLFQRGVECHEDVLGRIFSQIWYLGATQSSWQLVPRYKSSNQVEQCLLSFSFATKKVAYRQVTTAFIDPSSVSLAHF
jgi:hypothetical protein